MDQSIVQGIQLAMLAAFKEEDGLLDGAMLRLFKSDSNPTELTVIGDLTAADFSGYAAEAITWNDPSISASGIAEMVGVAGEFRPTADTIQNEIYGAYVTTSGGALFSAGRLDDAPEPMGSVDNSMLLTLRVRLSPLGVPTVVIT